MAGAITLTFSIIGMHCASCALLIDDVVEDVDGVERSQTDARHDRTVVVAAPSVSVSAIVTAIAEAGYQAEPVDA